MQPEPLPETSQVPTMPVGSEASRGSYVTTVHTGRRMKAYCVYERELQLVSQLNDMATTNFSLCGSFFAFGLSAIFGAVMQGLATLSQFSAGALVVTCIVCFAGAAYFGRQGVKLRRAKADLFNEIKSESFDAR